MTVVQKYRPSATGDGLFLVDAEGRQLRLLTGGREPLALARAGPDTLLVGTDLKLLMLAGDSAISIWNLRNNSWETIGISEGLPVTEITALYADEEHLWIAGPAMISRFNHRRGLPRR